MNSSRTAHDEQACFDFVYEDLADEANELLDRYLREVWARAQSLNWKIKPVMFPAGRRIIENDRLLQVQVIFIALARLLADRKSLDRERYSSTGPLAKLISRIARRRLPISPEETVGLVGVLADHASFFAYSIPILGILRLVKRHLARRGLTSALRRELDRLQKAWQYDWYFNDKRLIRKRIAALAEV